MGWKQERDLLIAQTMAFVQSVTGTRPEVERGGVKPNLAAGPGLEPAPFDATALEATGFGAAAMRAEEILGDAGAPSSDAEVHSRTPRTIAASDVRTEIQARVANFRAHQERFNREREEYFSATLGKLRAAIDDVSAPDPSDRAPSRH